MFCLAEGESVTYNSDCTYWLVDDVLLTLQRLAAAVRQNLLPQLRKVIAITGSNGKTIVKEWLYALLGGKTHGVYRAPGSFNSQLGVALAILQTPSEALIAIYEAGISRPGEMSRLEAMIKPHLGIFTNLGTAHAAGFSGSEEKMCEKALLFSNCRSVIYQMDDARVHAALHDLPGQLIAWSANANPQADVQADFTAEGLLNMAGGLPQSNGQLPHRQVELFCPFKDSASRQNLANALLAAMYCGLGPELLEPRIHALPQNEFRLSLKSGREGARIIDDTYNSDEEGLRAALEFFTQQSQVGSSKILVLGPLMEHGQSIAVACRKVADLLAPLAYDKLLTIGDQLAGIDKQLPVGAPHQHMNSYADLERELLKERLAGATVLIKGPRQFQLERLSQALQRQTHPVRLEISLDALGQNLQLFRARLKRSTKICIMLKASAYGSGSSELVKFFEQRGVDYLAVANVDEGIDLRRAGSQVPIIVANAQPYEYGLMADHRLEPEISNLRALESIDRFVADSAIRLPVHLKIDTGMNRLGFQPDEAEGSDWRCLLQTLAGGRIELRSIFSHLVASELEAGDEFSRKQNQRLEAAATRIREVLPGSPMIHLLNSSGVLRMPEFQHDMVRLGIGLYGISDKADYGLVPAHKLLAQLVQIKTVEAGEYVGYGLRGEASYRRRIGVVNIGYADGLRRHAGHGRFELTVNGIRVPTVGSVCMDFCMVDLTGHPEVVVGTEVLIFKDASDLARLATVCETIPYEILTGIGPRVQRIYYQ
jgi:alanine racemase